MVFYKIARLSVMTKRKILLTETQILKNNKSAERARRAAGVKPMKMFVNDEERVAADKASKRKYRNDNRDVINARARVSRAAQRERGEISVKLSPEKRIEVLAKRKAYRLKNREKIRDSARKSYIKNATRHIWGNLKARAKKQGIPFDLEESDVVAPECCPVLGIKLERSGGLGRLDSSPSVDRIIPSLGYVKGNVVVISYRANRIKNDATLEELRKITLFYEKQFEMSGIALLRLMENL
jgi:hypothetical protein